MVIYIVCMQGKDDPLFSHVSGMEGATTSSIFGICVVSGNVLLMSAIGNKVYMCFTGPSGGPYVLGLGEQSLTQLIQNNKTHNIVGVYATDNELFITDAKSYCAEV